MELVLATIVSGVFSVIIVTLIQRNWERKWKYNFDLEKYKIRNKRTLKKMDMDKLKNVEPKTPLGEVGKYINLIKDLDPEQLSALKDAFLGGEEEDEEGILDKIPPDVISGFLKGLGKKDGMEEAGLKEGY